MSGKRKGRIIVFSLILIIIVIAVSLFASRQVQLKQFYSNPENLRAMDYNEIEEDDEKVKDCENVRFSAFFTRDRDLDGYAEKLDGTSKEIGKKDTLYVELNVLTKGTLKNGVITVNGENFKWTTSIVEDKFVKGDYIGETSSISLKDIKSGSQKLLWGTIESKIDNNIGNYSKVNSVTLTGTYEDDEGHSQNISKTVNLTVDWYGETETAVNKYYYSSSGYSSYQNQMYDIATVVKDSNVELSFKVAVSEKKKQLLLQKQELELEIPDLNGVPASEVTVLDKSAKYDYNPETKILKITRESTTETGKELATESTAEPGTESETESTTAEEASIVSQEISRSNINSVVVKYPLEAYTSMSANSIVLSIPVKGKNYGYNNKNSQFTNPHVSEDEGILTVTYSKPNGDVWNIYPYIRNYNGEYVISKEVIANIYNGNVYEDMSTKYLVEWEIVVGDYTSINKITLEEQKENEINMSDKFLNTLGTYTSMYDYITTTGIYFQNASSILGNDGWIKLYNAETNSLIETFTSSTWRFYTKENPYNVDVKSIEIETSNPVSNSSFSVYQIKGISDELLTKKISQSEFEKLSYIYTYLKGQIEAPNGIKFEDGSNISKINKSASVHYEMPYSIAKLAITPKQITNQKIKNVDLIVETMSSNTIEKQWINGIFLIEFPEDIINVNLNDIEISDKDVDIVASDIVEENGKYFIKIFTSNEGESKYKIKMNLDISGNPLKPTETQDIKLYSYNQNCDNYYNKTNDIYDIDDDEKVDDNIGYTTENLTLIAPSGLVTTEYVTDYDDLESTTIAPNVADIEKSDESKTAKINVNITNNYSGTISDIVILGKIPFKDNTYVLSNEKLNSQYTANITGPISVPEDLKSIAKVYYSTNENPTKDLDNESNGWKLETNIKDWNKIRTYLIVLGDYKLEKEKIEVFIYEVQVPAGLGYNSVSYCNHAVYFNLDTEKGKLKTETEPNKVGIQVVSKYSMELTKNKKAYNDMLVKGATYSITTTDVDGKEIKKSAKTDENGVLKLSGIYVDREYILKEISSPSDYILNENEVKFKAEINEVDGVEKLEFKVIEGKFKGVPVVDIDEKENYLVKVNVEDEAKFTIVINKTNEKGEPLKDVKFLINGKGKASKIYKTDENGVLNITGFYVGEKYEIQEIKADGYYVDQEAKKFKVIRDESGILIIQSEDEIFSGSNIVEKQGIAQAILTVNIKNEKIPTYNLKIVKVEENINEDDINNLKKLNGASFKLVSEDLKTQKEYIVNEEGITITDLVAFVDGKYITGKYTLQETKSPDGYSNNAEEINFKVTQNSEGILNVEIEDEEKLTTLKSATIEENTLKIVIQDKPMFKITKIDLETGAPLANAQFIIYELDEFGNEKDYAKDVNGIYVGDKNQYGEYIVTTDKNGVISLPLKAGTYKIVEVGFPDGYLEYHNFKIFKVDGYVLEDVIENQIKDDDVDNSQKILEINYIEDLVKLSKDVEGGNKYIDQIIKLEKTLDFNDDNSYIDINDTSFGDLNKNGKLEGIKLELTNKESGIGFTPIGNYTNYFSGEFDGQNNEIRNIYIGYNTTYSGLFGYINGAEIKNLGVLCSVNSESYGCIAGITGFCLNSEINNCYNIGDIITNSSMSYCYVGGIAANSSNSKINYCYNNGNIKGNGYAGGIVGNFNGTINNCYNNGNITSNGYAGGICGFIGGSKINNSYNVGNVSSSNVGGIAGIQISSTVNKVYCLNTTEIKGKNINSDIQMLSEEYMKSYNFVIDLGIIEWNLDENNINKGYPILQKESSCIDTVEELVSLSQIVNKGNSLSGQIIKLGRTIDFNANESYKDPNSTIFGDLNADDKIEGIKAELTNIESGKGFSPIGFNSTNYFAGIFDGQGNEIKNIYINSSDIYIGFFGYIIGGEVKRLGITGYITNDYNNGGGCNVGAIVGFLVGGKITDCYNTSEIKNNSQGSNYIGGIVGNLANNCIINNCYNNGYISDTAQYPACYIGGIAGYLNNNCEIKNCYNKGNINVNDSVAFVGGISGCSYGEIIDSYNIAELNVLVSNISFSYTGGITGGIYSNIVQNCYNTGDINVISNNSYTGGISGSNSGSIQECYNKGDMSVTSNNSYLGGICGYTSGSYAISDCYNVGNVINEESKGYIGGIVAFASSQNILTCYYLDSIIIKGNYNNSIGKSLSQGYMKSNNFIYDFQGFSFGNDFDYYNEGFPILEMQTEKNISYVEDLVYLSQIVNGKESKLKDNIGNIIFKLNRNIDFNIDDSYRNINNTIYGDLNNDGVIDGIKKELTKTSAIGFTPIGNIDNKFSGTFDGQGYEIRNLYINSKNDYVGFFGNVKDAKICNFGITGQIKVNADGPIGGMIGSAQNVTISNCYNKASVTHTSGDIAKENKIGGIVGESIKVQLYNCYNTGDITSSCSFRSLNSMAGIVGYGTCDIYNTYNSGTILGRSIGENNYNYNNGGIVGCFSNGCISNSYNLGTIKIINTGVQSQAGGIAAINYDTIKNCYNEGDINVNHTFINTSSSTSDHIMVGGIVGIDHKIIKNCYNVGSIETNVDKIRNGVILGGTYCGGIYGYFYGSNSSNYVTNSYYSDIIEIDNSSDSKLMLSDVFMMTDEFCNMLNEENVWMYVENDYPKLINEFLPKIEDSTEITIENTMKEYKITTDVLEINGEKGGTITGEDKDVYELVKSFESNKNEIVMIPETGFGIINITINGEKINYIVNEDGTYKIPAGYFQNMQEDKHIEVTFTPLDQLLTLNKVDEEDNTKVLENAKFLVEEIDPREITNQVGALTEVYNHVINKDKEVTDVLGEMTNNGEYYFIKNGNTYVSGNYNIKSSVANSYVKLDLTNKTGIFMVVVNAKISSENYDKGYATITNTKEAPKYNDEYGRFIYISGKSSDVTESKDYQYENGLRGGYVYYLHFGYYKDHSGDTGDDKFTINSIKVYEADAGESYNFKNVDGKYIIDNNIQNSKLANSYIPIDLTEMKGKFNLKVNAEISSQSSNYGYVTITDSLITPKYNYSKGRLVYISGTCSAQDYTTVLTGGKLYYLHLGYYKNSSTNSGDDTFTINNIELSLNQDDLYKKEHTTNSYGQIRVDVPQGKYKITEIQAPEGYTLNSESREVEVGLSKANTITITNKKQPQIIVHHYLKKSDGTPTTSKVAEDEIYKDDIGEEYTTSPHTDLENLTLEKDENGKFVIPKNATGTYAENNIEVNYYYEADPIELKIHHYMDGTKNKLVLDDVEYVDPEVVFDENGNYTVVGEGSYEVEKNEKYHKLLAQYDLTNLSTTVQENVEITDTLKYNTDSELSYFYNLKEYSIKTKVEAHSESRTNELTNEREELMVEGGTISGKDEEQYEVVVRGNDSTKDIVITPYDGYIIEKVTLNSTNDDGEVTTTIIYGEGAVEEAEISCIPNEDGSMKLTGFHDVVENKEIIVKLAPIKGTVIIHHYMENTGEEFETQPVRVVLLDGTICEDEEKTDLIGEKYASKAFDGSEVMYEVVSVSGEPSGDITAEVKNIYYYYRRLTQKITTEVIPHNELDEAGNIVSVKGGSISGETENPYETVLKFDDSTKEIKMIPEPTYRIKRVLINGEEITITKVAEDKSLTLDLFESVDKDIHVQVEFEKIPTKVTVEYKDVDTKESILEDKVINGIIDTEYDEPRVDVESYIPAELEPTNSKGKMTEEDIIVTYWYKKQFKVTTDVIEHEEYDSSGNQINVKGGTIFGEDLAPLELVARGANSTKTILMNPEEGYRIARLIINNVRINIKDLLREDGSIELPIFENMQEDKNILVEFERIPGKVIIKYLDEETDEEISEEDIINGYLNTDYESQAKDIEGYELVKDKLPKNAKGKMTEKDIIVKYYYKKIKKEEIQIPEVPAIPEIPEENKVVEPNDYSNIDSTNAENSNIESNSNKLQDVKCGDNILIMVIMLIISGGAIVIVFQKHKNK